MAAMSLRLVATCGLGLEELLETELRDLGAGEVRRRRAAVSFAGSWRDVLRANYRLRTANRVLVELADWDGATAESLAAGASRLVESSRSWDGLTAKALFHPRSTFAVRATAAASRIKDRRWVALKVKDGLVDAQRRRHGHRASVERRDPDLHLRLRLFKDRATLLLDTSGESLDHRGYRLQSGPAPVREQLAAACVLASGWDGVGPVVDPMCGTGTLLAEAAYLALGWAPGRLRENWAFEAMPGYGRLAGFDAAAWEAVRGEALPAPGPDVRLFGVDTDPAAIAAATVNLERAGLAARARLEVGDGHGFAAPPGPGLVLVNPAYGERLEEGDDQWPRLGDLLKQRFGKGPGGPWRAAVLAGGEDRGKHIGLKPRRRVPVWNGPLEARILVFDLY
jgi:23S rRNA G2445 N2-methylase RlmL